MTYTEHAQRLLDQAASPSLDRIASQPAILSGSVAAKPTPFSANLGPFNPCTSHDVQEALSRLQGRDTIWLLPLTSGRWAIANRAAELQGIIDGSPLLDQIRAMNKPPAAAEGRRRVSRATTLEDLGL